MRQNGIRGRCVGRSRDRRHHRRHSRYCDSTLPSQDVDAGMETYNLMEMYKNIHILKNMSCTGHGVMTNRRRAWGRDFKKKYVNKLIILSGKPFCSCIDGEEKYTYISPKKGVVDDIEIHYTNSQ